MKSRSAFQNAGAGAMSILLIGGWGCGAAPTEPSEPLQAVVIYQDESFAGSSVQLLADVQDLAELTSGCVKESGALPRINFDDCVSSVRVPEGWIVTLYEDPRFGGTSLTLTSDLPDLKMLPGRCGGSFNDCASSIRLRRRPPP
jgi:hypothetical protein